MRKIRMGFVCFGEVNTPYEVIERKRGEALEMLKPIDADILDGGIVTDDAKYADADAAVAKLQGREMDLLVVCVAGWIPTHAVIHVTDHFRHLPMVLWGLCGWKERGHTVTTADQAGTTALRPTFAELGYTFRYVYNVMGRPAPVGKIDAFACAARAAALLRETRCGTMGYRDMLLYGTQFEGNSLRREIGVEVEPFEMLEMVQNIDKLDPAAIAEKVEWVKKNWKFEKSCDDSVIENGVKYALAVGRKIEERGWQSISLIDVDGMKKLLGFPPAMVFMLLDEFYGVQTIPENDVMGSVTQLLAHFLTGQTATYLEFYEFFTESVLIGVPDFIPKAATLGDVSVLPTAFGLLSASLLNISKVKTGRVTLCRLIYTKGQYKMHLLTGEAKTPDSWEECGWTPPAPQLPSLEVKLDIPVEKFAEQVSSQHIIVTWGDNTDKVRQFCKILNIEVMGD